VRFSSAPEEQFWGGWLATFADPAGNAFQLVQYPTGR
jgi:predicted enzyme related to lactoylglutathione lyase